MIPIAYAIIDPRAMMIISLNTSIAYKAMSTSWCLDNFAVGTKSGHINFMFREYLYNLSEFQRIFKGLHIARMG